MTDTEKATTTPRTVETAIACPNGCGAGLVSHYREGSGRVYGCGKCRTEFTEKQIMETRKPSELSRGEDRRESIHHPQHYGGDTTYEAIKVIRAWGLNFSLGNAVKYICRAGKKGATLEDLQKARWYLDEEIKAQQDALPKLST